MPYGYLQWMSRIYQDTATCGGGGVSIRLISFKRVVHTRTQCRCKNYDSTCHLMGDTYVSPLAIEMPGKEYTQRQQPLSPTTHQPKDPHQTRTVVTVEVAKGRRERLRHLPAGVVVCHDTLVLHHPVVGSEVVSTNTQTERAQAWDVCMYIGVSATATACTTAYHASMCHLPSATDFEPTEFRFSLHTATRPAIARVIDTRLFALGCGFRLDASYYGPPSKPSPCGANVVTSHKNTWVWKQTCWRR